MTKDEFAAWQAHTKSTKGRWVQDEALSHNTEGVFVYTGGVEKGKYIHLKGTTIEFGTYEDAFPHVGDASFRKDHELPLKKPFSEAREYLYNVCKIH